MSTFVISNSFNGWKSYGPDPKYALHQTMLTFDLDLESWGLGVLQDVLSNDSEHVCIVISNSSDDKKYNIDIFN